jgi:hypothetical protein
MRMMLDDDAFGDERCHDRVAGKTLTAQAVVKAVVRAHAQMDPVAPQHVAIRLNCAELSGGPKVSVLPIIGNTAVIVPSCARMLQAAFSLVSCVSDTY